MRVNDEVEQAFRAGYTQGLKEAKQIDVCKLVNMIDHARDCVARNHWSPDTVRAVEEAYDKVLSWISGMVADARGR